MVVMVVLVGGIDVTWVIRLAQEVINMLVNHKPNVIRGILNRILRLLQSNGDEYLEQFSSILEFIPLQQMQHHLF